MAMYQQEGSRVTLPPLIDCHVHFREPGLETKADMRSESEAAYYGGISAVCDMPNTMPPTQSIAALADKVARSEASANRHVKMFFFFGATAESHLAELEALWTNPAHAVLKARCCGLKLYLDNSTGNLKSSASTTAAAFALCGRLDIPLVAHCEQAEINNEAAEKHPYSGPASHSQRRPAESEVASIAGAIELAARHNTPLHIAHLSTRGGLDLVRQARRAHPTLRLTCEVTPHHLFLTADEDYSCCCGSGARVKVNPPIRPVDNRDALWDGVVDGTVDCIGTDHAPHTLEEKEAAAPAGTNAQPPSGMPAIELVVPLLLTVVSAGRWPHPSSKCPDHLRTDCNYIKPSMERLIEMLHTNPNRIFRLGLPDTPNTTFDVETRWVVDEKALHSKCKWSPYQGWTLSAKFVPSQ